jgi:cell division protein FtsI/penicillin-binding protein 2
MRHENTLRYQIAGVGFLLLGIMILGQLVRIQIIPQADEFIKQADLFSGEWVTIYPARGQIYDRWGNLLAGNTTVYEVGVELRDVRNPDTIAMTLAAVLDADYEAVLAAASQPASENAVYAVLADFVLPEKIALLDGIQANLPAYVANLDEDAVAPSLRGLTYIPHLQRSYPENSLASNVLGFVSREGRGYFGVEEKYNDLLAGQPKTVWMPRDPNRVEAMPNIPPGASLILTIDRNIQAETEIILDRALEETGAAGGSILIIDPKTGEILADASTPRMDLNEYWQYGEIYKEGTAFDRGVSGSYEPGSVFKVLTMAAAMDQGVIDQTTPFLDTGVFEIGGVFIRNWNQAAWGPQDMLGCMQHSLNVCLAWIASELGPNNFYRYLEEFGIGHTTGVDMAGEANGRLKVPGDEDWFAADLGTNSFGQGVAVTPVQMVMAVSALANEGKMVAPHILRSMVNNGHQYDPATQIVGVPISAETARTMTELLADSLEQEASSALVPGYRVAGKTGTAEIPTPYGYTSAATNASFVGWGPVDDPQFLIYIWLEEPTASPWGSVVAAPVFREVAERLVVLMNIPPDHMRLGMSSQ